MAALLFLWFTGSAIMIRRKLKRWLAKSKIESMNQWTKPTRGRGGGRATRMRRT